MIGLSGQAFAQAPPAPNIPQEWISSVDPTFEVEPETVIQSDRESPLSHDADFDQDHPLANLRQADPSGLLTEGPEVEVVIGDTNYSRRQNHAEETLAVGWNQPDFQHRKLYFEDLPIERGNDQASISQPCRGCKFRKIARGISNSFSHWQIEFGRCKRAEQFRTPRQGISLSIKSFLAMRSGYDWR